MRSGTCWAVAITLILAISTIATLAAIEWNEHTDGSTSIPISGLTQLQQHWVQGWGFRDELNPNDIDNQNSWMDNAGKILTAGMITNDSTDAHRALGFILSHMTGGYYLPEVVVNSSILNLKMGGSASITNRIAMITDDESASELLQLWVGDYYAGPWNAAYMGVDRIWYDGAAHRANSSTVVPIPGGYSKISYFAFDGLSFYTYLNATMRMGDPYVRISVQVRPMNSTFGSDDHVDLQVFAGPTGGNTQLAFESVSLFDSSGKPIEAVPLNNAIPPTESGILVTYSNRTNFNDQDSIAIAFNSTDVASAEHWYLDGAFDGMSWAGLGYNVAETGKGELSVPVYADIYPIRHFDYRLLNNTTSYLATGPKNVSVAPPVTFGFISYGLSLLAQQDSGYSSLARGFWNYYYAAYAHMSVTSAYSRSTNLLALAGFAIYGCNSTVEAFTRAFVERSPGASIEEYGWAAAAIHRLYECTRSQGDLAQYKRVTGSFVPSRAYFDVLAFGGVNANATFQFGEAASGLLIGGVPYNNQSVLMNMDAVYQSDVNGTIRNTPFGGDQANTETLPAYMISTWLFEGEMRNATDYWISGLSNCNVTSISYTGDTLTLNTVGRGGSLVLSGPGGNQTLLINGSVSVTISNQPWRGLLLMVVAVTAAIVLVILICRNPFGRGQRGFGIVQPVKSSIPKTIS